MEPASTGPVWNDDACEPDGVRNADGVLISSRRLLAELVDEPPKDGPSFQPVMQSFQIAANPMVFAMLTVF